MPVCFFKYVAFRKSSWELLCLTGSGHSEVLPKQSSFRAIPWCTLATELYFRSTTKPIENSLVYGFTNYLRNFSLRKDPLESI